MPDGKVYRVTEVVGTSQESIEDALRTAIKRADATLRNLDWFEVSEIRGTIKDGDIGEVQVAVKIGFRLDG